MTGKTEWERGYSDGFSKGWHVGLVESRSEMAPPRPNHHVPRDHLPGGKSIEGMNKAEVVGLLEIKCSTINQQTARQTAVMRRIEGVLGLPEAHASVPFETVVERLIGAFERSKVDADAT